MEGADLSEARFNSATSFGATSLRSAALTEIDVSMTDLTQDQVDATFGDASVILPDGVTRPTHWVKWKMLPESERVFYSEWQSWQADPENYAPRPSQHKRTRLTDLIPPPERAI